MERLGCLPCIPLQRGPASSQHESCLVYTDKQGQPGPQPILVPRRQNQAQDPDAPLPAQVTESGDQAEPWSSLELWLSYWEVFRSAHASREAPGSRMPAAVLHTTRAESAWERHDQRAGAEGEREGQAPRAHAPASGRARAGIAWSPCHQSPFCLG